MTAQHTNLARTRRAAGTVACAALAVASSGLVADAQRADSARAAVRARAGAARDTLRAPGPPISARRAFLRSLLIPGWGQSSLGRGTAGGIFVAVELLSAAMVVKSKQDLDFAKRFRRDSIVTEIGVGTGGEAAVTRVPNPLAARVRPRRQHLEDWIALLAFNHLFSGADAFVAAQLWDVPGRVSVRPTDAGGVALSARVTW
jgi:hypothetical protein